MRLVIDKKSTSISVSKINRLCNKKKADDDIELPVVMADSEKSLTDKMEHSVKSAPQAYQDDDDDSEIDDLFGMVDDDDDDNFEEGEFELGDLEIGENLSINNSPIEKSTTEMFKTRGGGGQMLFKQCLKSHTE